MERRCPDGPATSCRHGPSRKAGAKLDRRCFIVRDANGQALAYVYFEEEPGGARRPSCSPRDEARRITVNIAKLPELQHIGFCAAVLDWRGSWSP